MLASAARQSTVDPRQLFLVPQDHDRAANTLKRKSAPAPVTFGFDHHASPDVETVRASPPRNGDVTSETSETERPGSDASVTSPGYSSCSPPTEANLVALRRSKGGNPRADGKKKANFSTSCSTAAKRKTYLRNKVERIFPRNMLTFHHNAGGTHVSALLLEDGRFVLQGDAALGRQLWEDPAVLERLFKLFPSRQSIEMRRLESPEFRADYGGVKAALSAAGDGIPRVVSSEVKQHEIEGNNGSKVTECYLAGTVELPSSVLEENAAAATHSPQEVPVSVTNAPAPDPMEALVASICDNWAVDRAKRFQSKFGGVAPAVLDVQAIDFIIPQVESLPAWRPQTAQRKKNDPASATKFVAAFWFQNHPGDAATRYSAPPNATAPSYEDMPIIA